jgi:exodeoxyribonuclease VII large subunit
MDAFSPDVILLTRGGGSKDSLWTFNERDVAQAVFDCETPIVSAIGHDRDHSLTDDIADHHESTPTGAALFLTEDFRDLIAYLDEAPDELLGLMNRKIKDLRGRVRESSSLVKFNSPQSRLDRRKKELEKYGLSLKNLMDQKISSDKARLDKSRTVLPARMDRALKKAHYTNDLYVGKLEGLSPVSRLKSGFSYVSDASGKNIRSVAGVKKGDELKIRVTDGEIVSVVEAAKSVAEDKNGSKG